MNQSLLEVENMDTSMRQGARGPQFPAMIEKEVNPALAPFLVSSTRSVLWVDHASKAGMIRAAVRDRAGLEAEIIAAVAEAGVTAEWGNVHGLTDEGIKACVDHLAEYELTEVEALVNPETDLEGLDFGALDIVQANWMPQEAVVFVPKNRSFVGTVGFFGQSKAVAIIHNASRGIAIAHR
jgi:hypothetical protein